MSHWNTKVREARLRLVEGGRVYTSHDMLKTIDDVVLGLTRHQIMQVEGFSHDLVITALGHVTTAIQGSGDVLPLEKGGWYSERGGSYSVADGFAEAWKLQR